MAEWELPSELVGWIAQLAWWLDKRIAFRLLPLFCGILFAQGRRTVSSWLRAAGLSHDYADYYYFLGTLGRKTESMAATLLHIALSLLAPGDRLLFGIDDSPTKRYGPKVEGAGVHHNPTPGPADQQFLFGHIWVTLAWLVRHPLWGTIGLPLRARLYVRQAQVAPLAHYRVTFRTKLQMAADLVRWLADRLKFTGKTLWVVADGAYAKRPLLRAAHEARAVVVSRLRKDASLWSVPRPQKRGMRKKRGRRATYGKQAISLAKRAAHPRGWQQGEFLLYGKLLRKTYKTFLATWRPAGGLIRVVLVKEDEGSDWKAYFCTDPEAEVCAILEAVADRSTMEQVFHDSKEVHGTGQQQVRNYWANIAVYHLILWWHTLVELWAWHKSHAQLCDRSQSPWDDAQRRPSHADRRNALRRQCIQDQFRDAGAAASKTPKIRRLLRRVLALVA